MRLGGGDRGRVGLRLGAPGDGRRIQSKSMPVAKRNIPVFWAAAGFFASLAVFHLTVLRVPTERTTQASLHPWPDGAEYLDGARSLVREGSYTIHVAGRSLPPRYPPGYSSLIAVALEAGAPPLRAPYLVNSVAGLLLLSGLFLLLYRNFGRWEAGLGALLLATLPAFSILARAPMSDLTSALVVLASLWLLYRYATGSATGWVLTGALLLGASPLLRLSNLLYLPFLVAALWARPMAGRRRLSDSSRALAALAVGLLPCLVFNWKVYGSPWATGYGFWLQSSEPDFALHHLFPQFGAFWREVTQRETEVNTAALYGAGSYFGPAFVALALLGAGRIRRDRLFWSFGLAATTTALAVSCYWYQDFRLAFPLLVLAVPLAARGSVFLVSRGYRRNRLLALPAALLVVCAVVGWPPKRSDTELGDMLRPLAMHFGAGDFELVKRSEEIDPSGPRLILTNMSPPFVHALTEGRRVIAPLDETHDYRFNPTKFSYGVKERDELMGRAISGKWTVLALVSRRPIEEVREICPPPPGWKWETVEARGAAGGVARLTARSESEAPRR